VPDIGDGRILLESVLLEDEELKMISDEDVTRTDGAE